MAMNYTSLTAAKGVAGSVQNYVSYNRLDISTIVDEAQALIYSLLRCREMRTTYTFQMLQGNGTAPLPSGFLDPIGRMFAPSLNITFQHKDENFLLRSRMFQETSGTFGNNPFTTTNGATTVSVALTGHGFSQDSPIVTAGSSAVGGITPNGSFLITSITNANTFVIDTLTQTASSSVTGGGASATYVCDSLIQGTPCNWAIWDELIHFDFAFSQTTTCYLQYFRSLPLLSSTNQSNFITNRYPHLMRTACQASAADFMKDDGEYQKSLTRLTGYVQAIAAENDMFYRGAEIDAETP